MDKLDYARMMAATLRRPGRAPEPSVMDRPAGPEWRPEYEQEPPLEAVSPEDFVPNPKSLVAALKGAPAMVGVIGSLKWPKEIVESLRIKKLDSPTYDSWDVDKKFPLPYELTLPAGKFRSDPKTVFAGESTVDAHIKRYLADVKAAKRKITPPSEDVMNLINRVGESHYRGEYLPYGGAATTHYQEIPISKFLKKFPQGKSENSYNYGIGVQGIAHGVSPTGEFLPLHNANELIPGSYVAGRTDDAAEQTIWKLLEDR